LSRTTAQAPSVQWRTAEWTLGRSCALDVVRAGIAAAPGSRPLLTRGPQLENCSMARRDRRNFGLTRISFPTANSEPRRHCPPGKSGADWIVGPIHKSRRRAVDGRRGDPAARSYQIHSTRTLSLICFPLCSASGLGPP
jgi:hypothetical protein